MPSPRPTLTLDAVHAVAAHRCLGACTRPLAGVELEWLVFDVADRSLRPEPEWLRRCIDPGGFPDGSTLSFEPGGQLELSTPPGATLDQAVAAAAADLAAATAAAGRAGVRLAGLAGDPVRPPRRVIDTPRYRAMEAYFDGGGPAGRRMMCNTAAVHVNVGLGTTADDVEAQWRLAHDMGPVLAAAFANSPLVEGRASGFLSSRLAAWWAMDQTRTAPVAAAGPESGGMSACEEWAEYVLEAKVMLIRAADGSFRPIESSLTFREWMEAGHELGYPAPDDLEYHMTTLFPPVRPRGWLELRMIDALPDPLWVVPLAVAAGLLLEPEGREQATAACAPAAGRWLDAMCSGLADAALAACAERCFDVADGALARLGVAGPTRAAVSDYAERYVARRRTPADDRLDLWSETGALLPGNATVPAAPGAVQG